jgi:hypothetical protein
LREIHDIGRAEDQNEAERNERVDRTDADPRKEELEGYVHRTV